MLGELAPTSAQGRGTDWVRDIYMPSMGVGGRSLAHGHPNYRSGLTSTGGGAQLNVMSF